MSLHFVSKLTFVYDKISTMSAAIFFSFHYLWTIITGISKPSLNKSSLYYHVESNRHRHIIDIAEKSILKGDNFSGKPNDKPWKLVMVPAPRSYLISSQYNFPLPCIWYSTKVNKNTTSQNKWLSFLVEDIFTWERKVRY